METSSIKSKIPNIITIIRILLTIPIIVLLLIPSFGNLYTIVVGNSPIDISWNKFIVFILFSFASFSDWTDGFLSRKFQCVSNFGKILDPIADKVLINSMFILFGFIKETYIVFPILFIFRDTIVDAMRMYAASKKINVAANMAGKLKTVLQMVAIMFVLWFGASEGTVLAWYYWGVQQSFFYLALIASFVSGGIYIYRFSKELKGLK